MEEILASIRRIIADDTGPQTRPYVPPNPPQQAAPAAAPEPQPQADTSDISSEADILELTQPVETGPAFTPVRGPDVVFREEEPRPARPAAQAMPRPAPVAPPAPQPASANAPEAEEEELLSPASTAAVSSAFNSLATTVIGHNSRTLEDLVKEMMRPMLRQWLDENLPAIVERLVRSEIERVSRGGR